MPIDLPLPWLSKTEARFLLEPPPFAVGSFDQDLGSDASSVHYRGSDHGWIDLGVIEDMDKPGIRREERARVLVRHVIADLVKEAYPLMSFDFGSLRATVNLKFRYERVFGFCKTCGMLKHGSTGCKGPPNMSEVVLLDGGSGGAVGSVVEASGSSPTQNPNPNKSMVRAKGGQQTPSLVATTPRGSNIPAVTNLFGRAPSSFTFSLLGISAADLGAGCSLIGSSSLQTNLVVMLVRLRYS
ncbi:hypothetical protein ACLB2K_066006 [Fragaria x ananassa]